MSGTYKAIGINLKSSPIGEADRLLTVLTDDWGLIRVVAPGARKHKSSLGGRSSLFVVNQLLLAKGRTLDKVVQAESVESFPGLSQNLCKLTAAQYLAELTLSQALSEQPQVELLCLLREHLSRIEKFPVFATLASLTHATFHLLALAGLTPQLQYCCLTQKLIRPEMAAEQRIGFSVTAGGTVQLEELDRLAGTAINPGSTPQRVASATGFYGAASPQTSSAKNLGKNLGKNSGKNSDLLTQLTPVDLQLLQQLMQPDLIQTLLETQPDLLQPHYQSSWLTLERVLRHYAQYHFDRPIRSASLIAACFTLDAPSLINHDAIV